MATKESRIAHLGRDAEELVNDENIRQLFAGNPAEKIPLRTVQAKIAKTRSEIDHRDWIDFYRN